MNDVDVHIIRYKEPDWMMDRCLASLEGQPVNIHIIQGIEEWPPYEGRKKGFASGTAKYCSFVDPDDEVMPGAYATLLEHDGADVIWGNERVITAERACVNKSIHHAYLVKRGLGIDYSQEFRAIVMDDTVSKVHVDEVLYVWNYESGTTAKRMKARWKS